MFVAFVHISRCANFQLTGFADTHMYLWHYYCCMLQGYNSSSSSLFKIFDNVVPISFIAPAPRPNAVPLFVAVDMQMYFKSAPTGVCRIYFCFCNDDFSPNRQLMFRAIHWDRKRLDNATSRCCMCGDGLS